MSEQALARCFEEAIDTRLSSGELTIPVLPAVASAVLCMIDDPDAEMSALASAIQQDQALAGQVMKYANSPALRGGAPIISLQQAITRLGMRSMADIALAACMGPKLFRAPRYAALIEQLWSESLATALWGREIARKLRRNVEVGFLCALLHQIGKPVVLQAIQELGIETGEEPDEALVASLLERFAVAAGQAVASNWRLPDPVLQTIVHIDDFRGSASVPELVALVAVARAFALQTLGAAEPDAQALMQLAEVEEINLYLSDAEQLLEQGDTVRATLREIAT